MLKIEKGIVTIKGSRWSVMSDLTTLICSIKDNLNIPKEDIIHAVDLAFKSFEDVEKEVFKKAMKMSSADIMNMLTAIALNDIMEERKTKEKKDNE